MELRARARRPPTFAVAGARVRAVGIAGVVEAVVEGQPGDTGQQAEEEQRAHGVMQGCSTSVWGTAGAQGRLGRGENPVREAGCRGVGTPGFQHVLAHLINR